MKNYMVKRKHVSKNKSVLYPPKKPHVFIRRKDAQFLADELNLWSDEWESHVVALD